MTKIFLFLFQDAPVLADWTSSLGNVAISENDILLNDISLNDIRSKDKMGNVFFSFCLLSMPIVLIALFSNGLAFLVFYKKPAFRKILSNK